MIFEIKISNYSWWQQPNRGTFDINYLINLKKKFQFHIRSLGDAKTIVTSAYYELLIINIAYGVRFNDAERLQERSTLFYVQK